MGPLVELPDLVLSAADSTLGPDSREVLAFAASWDQALPKGRYYTHREYDWLEPENLGRIADALWRLGTLDDSRVSQAPTTAV